MDRENIFQDNMGEENPAIEYKSLEDLIVFDNFSYNPRNYRQQELDILQPQLEQLGYTHIEWKMGEYDSFGPLTRVCKAKDPGGETVWFIYG